MYKNAYQRGRITIFFSIGSKPLGIWDTFVKDGYIRRFMDPDIRSTVFEIGGVNVSTTYMTCPKGTQKLGITMPFLVMIVKNLRKYFTFEVTILDESGTRRRFRVANFQSTTQILPLCTVMPINLSEGWNQIQFNLAEFTQRAYKKQFMEVQHLKINANIRIRRIYFAEKLTPEEELPSDFRLFFPVATNKERPKPLRYTKSRFSVHKEQDVQHTTSKDAQTEIIILKPAEGQVTSKINLIKELSQKSVLFLPESEEQPKNENKQDEVQEITTTVVAFNSERNDEEVKATESGVDATSKASKISSHKSTSSRSKSKLKLPDTYKNVSPTGSQKQMAVEIRIEGSHIGPQNQLAIEEGNETSQNRLTVEVPEISSQPGSQHNLTVTETHKSSKTSSKTSSKHSKTTIVSGSTSKGGLAKAAEN